MRKKEKEMSKVPLTDQQRKLVEEHVPFAMNMGKKYYMVGTVKGVPLEDLQQEACLGLIEAARRYEPGKGVNLMTYAFMWCKKYILKAAETQALCNDVCVRQLEDDVIDEDSCYTEALCRRVDDLLDELDTRERQVICLSFGIGCDPLSFKQIAEVLQIPAGRVRNIYERAINKMEMHG